VLGIWVNVPSVPEFPTGGPGIVTFSEYDPMGRVSEQWQYTPLGGQNEYSFPYTYDYLGDMTSASDGYFHGYYYTYNTAGRLTGLTSSLNNSQNPGTLLSAVHYNAAGQITSDTLGTNETETYTSMVWSTGPDGRGPSIGRSGQAGAWGRELPFQNGKRNGWPILSTIRN